MSGRDYDGPGSSVTMAAAQAEGTGQWTHVRDMWPTGWSLWASEFAHDAPTVLFLCSSGSHCTPYNLEGGP